jgi:hypothetical protein
MSSARACAHIVRATRPIIEPNTPLGSNIAGMSNVPYSLASIAICDASVTASGLPRSMMSAVNASGTR